MAIRLIDHINIWTEDLAATRAFYVDVLGLVEGPRPAFNFPGYWFYSGDRAIVHIQLSPGPVRPSPGSTLNHFAFDVDAIEPLLARLDAHGVPYVRTHAPGTDIQQAFFQDPNGARIEFNCAPPAPLK